MKTLKSRHGDALIDVAKVPAKPLKELKTEGNNNEDAK